MNYPLSGLISRNYFHSFCVIKNSNMQTNGLHAKKLYRIKNIFIILSLFTLQNIIFAQESPYIRQIINSVNIDTLKDNINILSGTSPFYLNSTQYTIQSRHIDEPGNELAAKFLSYKLQSFGLYPYEQNAYYYYDVNAKNLYAVQDGSNNSRTIIICAHYDDVKFGGYSPGADDNASGVCAVLECARLLTKYKTKYKIIYAFWDAEEVGLIGSRFFADSAARHRENIIAVINADMIGWDGANDSLLEVHVNDTANAYSVNLPEIFSAVEKNYNIGIKPLYYNPGTRGSDHYSFWLNHFNAAKLIEDKGDFNPHYHTISDRPEYFNYDYYHRVSQLAVATVATLAVIEKPGKIIPDDYFISQNYPNPFNSVTRIAYSLPVNSNVEIKVYNILGQLIKTLVSDFQPAGNHTIIFNENILSSGVYFYIIRAGNFQASKKMIYLK